MNPPETTNELRACEASTGTAAPDFVGVVGADRLRRLPDCVPGNGKIASLDSMSDGCSHTNFDPTVVDLKQICRGPPGLRIRFFVGIINCMSSLPRRLNCWYTFTAAERGSKGSRVASGRLRKSSSRLVGYAGAAGLAFATAGASLAAGGASPIRIELNKLEKSGEACRAYLLIDNTARARRFARSSSTCSRSIPTA